jgi:hypothetical protein
MHLFDNGPSIATALSGSSNAKTPIVLMAASIPAEVLSGEYAASLMALRDKVLALESKFEERSAEKEDLVARLMKERGLSTNTKKRRR